MFPARIIPWLLIWSLPLVALAALFHSLTTSCCWLDIKSANAISTIDIAMSTSSQNSLAPSVDIAVAQTLGTTHDPTVVPSQQIVVTIYVTNSSAGPVSGILVENVAPEQLVSTYVVSTVRGSNVTPINDAKSFKWQIDNLAENTAVNIYLLGTIDPHQNQNGEIVNLVNVSHPDDENVENNSSELRRPLRVPELSIIPSQIDIYEDTTELQIEVRLDPYNSYGDTLVDYLTVAGTASAANLPSPDYVGISGTVLIPYNEITTTFSITVLDDRVDEGTEYFYVTLTNPRGASLSQSNRVTIMVNDTDNNAGFTVAPVPLAPLSEKGDEGSYSIVLDSPPIDVVRIDVRGEPQIFVEPSQIEFLPETWNTPHIIRVMAIDDDIAEDTHIGQIDHYIQSTDPKYSSIQFPEINAQILDDDEVGFEFSTSVITITEGMTVSGEQSAYAVALTSEPAYPVTITLQSSSLQVQPQLLVFTPLNWDQPQHVSIDNPVSGTFLEPGESIRELDPIGHQVASPDLAYDVLTVPNVDIMLAKQIIPELRIAATNFFTTMEGAKDISYSIALSTQPSEIVTVISDVDSDQIVVVPGEIVFDQSNWNVSRPLTVHIIDDSESEGFHESIIEHTARSGDATYNQLGPSPVTVKIYDNDPSMYLPLIDND